MTSTVSANERTATPAGNSVSPSVGANGAPWVPWGTVHRYVNMSWDPEHNPHHSVIGLTGSGKSYLAVNGILRPMCKFDRVLLIDSKGDDKLVSAQGRPVRSIQNRPWYQNIGRKEKPFEHWQRLVVYDNRHTKEGWNRARDQVKRAIERVYSEGNWILFVDEEADLTTTAPGLGLRSHTDEVRRMGRSRSISVIGCTQSPVQVARSFYDQASWAWIGRIRDRDRQKRLLEIGGMTKDELPLISELKRQQWLLAADNGEQFYRSKVTARKGKK